MNKKIFPLAALMLTSYLYAEILPRNNQSIIFMGEEIVGSAAENQAGIVQLVLSGLKANNVNVAWRSVGAPGNKTLQMLQLLNQEISAQPPQFLVLACGVNEVVDPDESGSVENFQKQLQAIADLTRQNNIQLILLTPATAGNEQPNAKISKYAQIMRDVAKEKNIIVADTERVVRHLIDDAKAVILDGRGRKVTTDGIHLSPVGNQIVAREVLLALGLNNSELAQAEAAWNQIPAAVEISANIVIPTEYQEQLVAAASAANLTLEQLYGQLLDDGLNILNSLPTASLPPAAPEKLHPVAKIISPPENSVNHAPPDPTGNLALTKELMVAGGYTREQLTAAMNEWMGDNAVIQANAVLKIPLRRYNQILNAAQQRNTSVQAYQEAALRAGINAKLKK